MHTLTINRASIKAMLNDAAGRIRSANSSYEEARFAAFAQALTDIDQFLAAIEPAAADSNGECVNATEPVDETFFLVWNAARGIAGSPTVKHQHHWQASDEADRLARKYPGSEMFVLRATNKHVIAETPVTRVKLVEDHIPPIPF